ncbi:gliding motility-associated C-terminal domain-containing protein [Aquimarina litoralis]|uniref:gliding motility-associated C-terminal domain-containing protein n=1 Tax=Aquimarina litoralis TaxID=584605 RepID=UPI001C57798D|nr:gliding motility-associated C-terminal domain-containing protein [Aquimarina litoralis]MBW1294389.1 T9SS type B sorting domain-containing protein [Aquimarina litoralis]
MSNLRSILTGILTIAAGFTGIAQDAFHNFGNAQVHNGGQIGFHINVVNDGAFDNNVGKVGFYNQSSLTVSGDNKPVFHDVEIDVQEDLILEVGVGVTNFQEFVNGRVITDKNEKTISLDYMNDTPYLGESDDRYVDGYATTTGDLDFSFPVGDDFRLRPIKIEANAATNTARAAYFFENPNSPNFFAERFDTEQHEELLFGVSIFEFWDLDGDKETKVTLTWDSNSNIPTLVGEIEDLRVVGWSKALKKWVNLGNTSVSGDLNNGEISSDSINPNDYEVLTFGSSNRLLDGDLQIFTAVSPNGDGYNDTFKIQGLAKFPDNELSIYNRWGVLVFQKKAYHTDQNFAGISEGRATVSADSKLPEGTYYYVLNLKGAKDRAGYLYISR